MLCDLKQNDVIAVDTESVNIRYAKNVIALIQIATRKAVYLIPVHEKIDEPKKLFGQSRLDALIDIFNDPNILKVGFALINDIPLFESLSDNMKMSMEGWLCLQMLWGKT